jgi:hypothetical protein
VTARMLASLSSSRSSARVRTPCDASPNRAARSGAGRCRLWFIRANRRRSSRRFTASTPHDRGVGLRLQGRQPRCGRCGPAPRTTTSAHAAKRAGPTTSSSGSARSRSSESAARSSATPCRSMVGPSNGHSTTTPGQGRQRLVHGRGLVRTRSTGACQSRRIMALRASTGASPGSSCRRIRSLATAIARSTTHRVRRSTRRSVLGERGPVTVPSGTFERVLATSEFSRSSLRRRRSTTSPASADPRAGREGPHTRSSAS